MNRRLERFQNSNIIEDLELGLLSEGAFRKYVRYLLYTDYRKKGMDKMNATQCVAEDRNISFTSAWNAVEFFEGEIERKESAENEVQFFLNTNAK